MCPCGEKRFLCHVVRVRIIPQEAPQERPDRLLMPIDEDVERRFRSATNGGDECAVVITRHRSFVGRVVGVYQPRCDTAGEEQRGETADDNPCAFLVVCRHTPPHEPRQTGGDDRAGRGMGQMIPASLRPRAPAAPDALVALHIRHLCYCLNDRCGRLFVPLRIDPEGVETSPSCTMLEPGDRHGNGYACAEDEADDDDPGYVLAVHG